MFKCMIQEEALNILKSGANVFLTGEPGSGKTHTINRYTEYLRECGIAPAITASTGIAATHINGMTLHSWSGIGVSRYLTEDDLEAICSRKRLISRFAKTRVLIIDEISMLDAQTLDLAEAVCRHFKKNGLPWGGMQVIFVGDFLQLPPVSPQGEEPRKFAYQSLAWRLARPAVCRLSEQYRQDDKQFLFLLTLIREGRVTAEVQEILSARKLNSPPRGVGGTEQSHTRLYSHNIDVDRVNNEKLARLPGKEKEFKMVSRGPEDLVKQLKRGCLSPEILRLKVGAKVMFTKNDFTKRLFVNGTIGNVEKFLDDGAPLVRAQSGRLIKVFEMEWSIADGARTLAKISQIPLRLAWAITVHKSQGMTLDSATIDLSEAFEYGQGYTALSRVRNLESLRLLGYNEKSLQVHPEVLEMDTQFKEQSRLARQEFAAIPEEEKEKRQKNFIIACGGGAVKTKREKTEKSFALRASRAEKREDTYTKTLALWKEGKNTQEIAVSRGLAKSTVFSHLEELFMRGKIEADEFRRLASLEFLESLPEINSTFKELGSVKLTPVFEKFQGIYSYDNLRLARILLADSNGSKSRRNI